ncbi:hypothetical protein BT69DRAFT_983746 [Atractiella rhizophila]|nr:hypothetical protein BT69DRAFT_983746 [Atractiella rhizophila]
MAIPDPFPSFEELPSTPTPHYAGGVFAECEAFGTLNHLSPAVVAQAAATIKTGETVSLDWKLDMPKYPYCNRKRMRQEIKNRGEEVEEALRIDTKASSHWDWGGVSFATVPASPPSSPLSQALEDKRSPSPPQLPPSKRRQKREVPFLVLIRPWQISDGLIVSEIAPHGIVGRGILVDFARYIKKIGVDGYSAFSSCSINAEILAHILDEEQLKVEPGDILLIRTGMHSLQGA